MRDIADRAGLTGENVLQLHRRLLDGLHEAALADEVLTVEEHRRLVAAAAMLNMDGYFDDLQPTFATRVDDRRASQARIGERESRILGSASEWTRSLVDLGGRNRMLYFRDLKAGTLDLVGAHHPTLMRLLSGSTATIRRLFPDHNEQQDALRRTRAIRKAVQEWAEERGVDVGHIASGFATWRQEPKVRSGGGPCAPVLLFPVAIKASAAAARDFTLELTGTPILNPVLVHVLRHEHDVTLDPEGLLGEFEAHLVDDPSELFATVSRLAEPLPEFKIDPRRVLGTFVYTKLPMVQDIENAGELLTSSDVIAALAGDPQAQSVLRGEGPPISVSAPDKTPARDEFLVCDADSSQNYALNAIVAGHHLVVRGPPGTGKSQTIANAIAALAARGRSVLFVAEKRAAIEAVTARLKKVELEDLVLDLHGGSDRRRVASEVATRLARVRTEHLPQVDHLERLQTQRGKLIAHAQAMHELRAPWQVSAFTAQAHLINLRQAAVTSRLTGQMLRNLDEDTAHRLRQLVQDYTQLGEVHRDLAAGPWTGVVANLATAEAEDLCDELAQLAQQGLPDLRNALDRITVEIGLRPPAQLSGWPEILALLGDVDATTATFHQTIYGSDLRVWMAATADRGWRRRHSVPMGWRQRRRVRQHLLRMWRGPSATNHILHQAVARVAEQEARWHRHCSLGSPPRVPVGYQHASQAYEAVSRHLQLLSARLPGFTFADDLTVLQRQLDDLTAGRSQLMRMLRRREICTELDRHGLGRLLDELAPRHPDADQAAAAFDYLRYASILDHICATDPRYADFDGRELDRTVAEFQRSDTAHIDTTPARVRRAAAANLVRVLDAHPEQESLVRAQAARKRGHLPIRDLFRRAPQAMTAIKPCWAMSPLMVSQVLPPERHFDIVIFDEASQVPPVDGVPAIMRGRQVVVAGDEHQLPPTRFFAADDREEAHELDESLTTDVESLLESLAVALPFNQIRHLSWHYRSRDERLIAFSNRKIYAPHGNRLVTFPGAHPADTIAHVLADNSSDVTDRTSPAPEVDKVVRLVLEHASNHPDDTLGVITMGVKHADRVQAAIDHALADRQDLEDFFAGDRTEKFFVKNIERVQGDERDAIILSIGYGKGTDGRMIYRFGPINNDGGYRRLNVAITRARRRMTVVSSFGSHDLDPNRLHAHGAQLLRDYLEYAESHGTRLDDTGSSAPALNPFEADVHNRLTAAGIPLVAQYGASGYRIDFAAQHPHRPGQMILAIEADGAAYHSTPTARDRDRLRQQHLERLGWRFHRIWSTDWFRDADAETARARAAYDQALAEADANTQPASPPTNHGSDSNVDQPRTADRPPQPTRRARPSYTRGLKIDDYSHQQLLSIVQWVESDGILRTADQLLSEVMHELGYQRRGSRIVERVRAAIADTRDTEHG